MKAQENKFKVGDRVEDKVFGKGTIKHISDLKILPYAVEFDNPTYIENRPKCKTNHGAWCTDSEIKLITND